MRFSLAVRAVLLLATLVAAPASAKWREASSKHFVVYANQDEKAVRSFTESLERYHNALGYLYKVPAVAVSPANRVTVYVVTPEDVTRLLPVRNRNVAGFYIPRAGASAAVTPKVVGKAGADVSFTELVLLHEYAHHFMFQTFGDGFPAWFVEGFAEFYATARLNSDGSIGLGLPAVHRGYSLSTVNEPIEAVLSPASVRRTAAEVDHFYGRSWALVHMLTFGKDRGGQLTDYLARIRKGEEPMAAARNAFGDLQILDRDLDRYIRQKKMSYLNLAPSAVMPGPILVRELTADEVAILPVRRRSHIGVNDKTATMVVEDARKVATNFPQSAAVLAALAEAEYDAGNDDAAIAAADRALAIDPRLATARLQKAFALMRKAESTENGAPLLATARTVLLAANRNEPDDPRPLMTLYRLAMQHKGAANDNEKAALQQALALAPYDVGLRWTVVGQHITDGKLAEAADALKPIAFNPHPSPMVDRARGLLAELASGDHDKALAAFEATGAARDEGEGEDEDAQDAEESGDEGEEASGN